MKTLFIFGLGYSARYIAKAFMKEGGRVIATSREATPMDGVEVIRFDEDHPIEDFENRLKDVTHILHSIPPNKETGDCVYNHHMGDLQKLPNLEWMGYLSTTGVYGNADGATLTEDAERSPTSARARARKKAEDQWLASGLPIHLFRLAGIYGPTRSIFASIKNGSAKAIDKPGHAFSRIHVEDIAGVVAASMKHPNNGSAYNVCDNQPCEPIEVLAYACKLMGVKMPTVQTFEEASKTMSPMALTFWNDNKRVDNSKMADELDYQLKYPDYKCGLTAIWEEESK